MSELPVIPQTIVIKENDGYSTVGIKYSLYGKAIIGGVGKVNTFFQLIVAIVYLRRELRKDRAGKKSILDILSEVQEPPIAFDWTLSWRERLFADVRWDELKVDHDWHGFKNRSNAWDGNGTAAMGTMHRNTP